MSIKQSAQQSGKGLQNNQIKDEIQSTKKIIRPSYEHLGPTRINADDQKKWVLICYSLIFMIIIIIVSLISAFALPKSLIDINQMEWIEGNALQYCATHLYLNDTTVQCYNDNSNYSNFGAFVTNIKPLNQFLVLYLRIDMQYYKNKDLNLNENVNFTLYSAKRILDANIINVTSLITTKNISLNGKIQDIFKQHGKILIMFLTKLQKQDQYYWEIKYQNGSQLDPLHTSLQSLVVNQDFSLFTIILRVVLFIISLTSFILYNRLIFLIPQNRISVQQKFIQILSAMNLTFNDVFYAFTVLMPNPVSSFFSSFFLWNFVAYFFFIWILFLSRIRQQQSETQTKQITIPRSIIIFLIYLVILAYTVTYAVLQTSDHPVFAYEDVNSGIVIALQLFAFVLFSVVCVYIIYLFICVVREKPNRLYRHNIFMAFTFIFFICTVTFFFVGGYNLYDYSAAKIMFTLSFMNLYSFYLQYFYAPTSRQIFRFKKEKQDQALLNNNQQLIEIPSFGQVDVVLIDQSQNINQNKSSKSQQDITQNKDSNLSARQRRRKNRRIKNQNNKQLQIKNSQSAEQIQQSGQMKSQEIVENN